MANRYWVNGSGNWGTGQTANWSATSGGSGGASLPSTSDDVFFDELSGSGTVTLTSNISCKSLNTTGSSFSFVHGATVYTLTCAGNFTLSSSTTWNGTLLLNSASTITTNGVTLRNITFNNATATLTLNGALTSSGTFTYTAGTINLNNNTLTCNIFSSGTGNTRQIQFGTGNITVVGTGLVVAMVGTSFTYTGTPTVNISNSGSIAISVNTSTGFTSTNALNFNITSGTFTYTDSSAIYNNLNFTGFSGTLAGTSARYIFGNLTLSATATYSTGVASIFFQSINTQTITSNGITLNQPITKTGSGTLILEDAFTSNSSITLTLGTFTANNKNVTATVFNSTNSNVRTLNMGSGTWTLTASGTPWNAQTSTNFTLNAGSSTILFSNDTTTARTFQTGGLTYNNIIIGGNTSTSTFNIIGNGSFNTISSTKTVAHTVRFQAGQTFNFENWTISGSLGNIVSLTSTSTTPFALNKTGGGIIGGIDYLAIQYSQASPENTWYAGANSTNITQNTGWIFSNAPITENNNNFFLLM